jgi:hypothetical protein
MRPSDRPRHPSERIEGGKDGKGDELDEGDELLGCRADVILCRRRRLPDNAAAIKLGPV